MRLRVLVWWIAAAAVLWSCQELPPVNEPEEEVQEPEEEPGLPQIEDTSAPGLISAEIPSAVQTKVSLEASDAPGLALAWEAGDCLRIIGTSAEKFDIVEEGMTPSRAGFKGNPVNGSSFTVLYPGTYESEADWENRSYTGQKQSGNGTTSHLFWEARLKGLASYSSLIFGGDGFSENGVVKFSFVLPERFESLEKLSLTVPEAIFPTTNKADGPKAATLSLDLEDLTLADDSRQVSAYMMVSAVPVILQEGSEYTVTLGGPGGQEEQIVKTVPEGGLQIGGGVVTVIGLDAQDLQEPLFWRGTGTYSDPYEIKTLEHLQNIHYSKMSSSGFVPSGDAVVYFKLIEDISVGEWSMVNTGSSNAYKFCFDGDGHTLSNFSSAATGASFFGYMDGCTVKDLVFDTVTLSNDVQSSSKNGVATVSYYAINSTIDNVDVNNVTLTVTQGQDNNDQGTGAIAGRIADNTTVSGCNVTGLTITGSSPATRFGGIVGVTTGGSTRLIKECTVTDFSITASESKHLGGIVGRNSAGTGTSIEGCTVTGGSLFGLSSIGGIIGESGGVIEITGCKASGDLKTPATPGQNPQAFVGGIAGKLNGSIKQSASSVSISYTNNRQKALGGLVGGSAGAITVQESYYNGGTVNGMSQLGGLVGQCGHDLTLENCYSAGTLTVYDGYYGGLIGYISAAVTVKVSNSYSVMDVGNTHNGSNNALGGLIGGSDKGDAVWDVTGLLAWNNSITINTSTQTDGVIIGQIHPNGGAGSTSVTNCWYRNDLSYTKASAARTPGNDPDCTTANTQRYDGKRADSGVSCSAKAAEAGWDTGVWDLSGDYPQLKWLEQ
ncbi:MAG: hypothetical protein IJ813_00225 [Bacteroidales bacterium]|nr:hypothetical protein [Bacteroidales bacterium]